MRTISAGDIANLGTTQVDHHLRVEIQNASGVWVDFSTLASRDWVDGVSIECETLDQPVASASIALRRSAQGVSLAPLFATSAANTPQPALDLGRRVRISVSSRLKGVPASYKELFRGRVDAIGWEQDPMVVECSDEGAWLMDLQIESEREYVTLQLTSTNFVTITTGANSIVLASGDPRVLKGGLKVGDTIALTNMPDAANNKTVTVASLSATTVGTAESLVVNAVASALPVLNRQSTSIESVMQLIMDDNTVNAGLGSIALYTPVSPNWQVRAFRQDRKKLLEALRDLALQIGWEVRYRYDSTDAHRLTFFRPPRMVSASLGASATGFTRSAGSFIADGHAIGDTVWSDGYSLSGNIGIKTVTAVSALLLSASGCVIEAESAGRSLTKVNAVLTPSIYRDVRKLNIGLSNIRNVVKATAQDANGKLLAQTALIQSSITAVGRRYMELVDNASSNIDTNAELVALVTAAVSDLALPRAEHEVDLLLFWPLQFGDFLVFTNNGEHYSSDQAFGIVGLRHDFLNGEGVTTIRTRGTVAGSSADWLRRESHSLAPTILPAPIVTHEAEGTATGGADEGVIRVLLTFDKNTAYVEIYAAEGPDAGVAAPEMTSNRISAVLRRQEGLIASKDDWSTEHDIATTVLYYRKIRVLPVGFDRRKGDPTVLEARAVDAGVGPSGSPLALVVTMSLVGGFSRGSLAWTNSDVAAHTRIFRNGIVLVRLAPGVNSFVDDGLIAGQPYTYRLQHVRNGQSSGQPTSTTPSDSPTLSVPTDFYAAGGVVGSDGSGLVTVGFSNPDPQASTIVQMAPDVTGSPGGWSEVADLGPGVNSVTLNSAAVGAAQGPPYHFRAYATRRGYTNSIYTGVVTATFGLAI